MKIMTWNELFGPITGKQNPKRKLGSKFSEWRMLTEDTNFNGYEYAKGSYYKCFESRDFGYVVFNKESKCPNGNIPGKFIHRF